MEIEELRTLADSFFEWPTEDRTQVTLTSALLFAQHVLRATQQAGEPVGIRAAIVDALLATRSLSEGVTADAILSLFDQRPIGVISAEDEKYMASGGNGVVLYANRLADKSEVYIPVFLSPTPQAQPAPIPTSELDEFMRGAMVAISCLVRCHGPSQYAADTVIQLGFSGFDLSNLGLEEFDLEPLRELNEYNALGLTMPPAPGGSDE